VAPPTPIETLSTNFMPNRLLPFCFHFFRQFLWGCLGMLTFPILWRAVFASMAYATKRITDTVLSLHNPAIEAGSALFRPFVLFSVLVIARFALEGATWFCSYHTRSSMLVRIKEEVFAYAQRLSPAYFESTLCGKIAHRTVMLPDQVLMLFDSMVLEFIPGSMFFLFVAAYFYIAGPFLCVAAMGSIAVYCAVSLYVGQESTRHAVSSNEARAAVTGRIVDAITNIRNVFLFANQVLEDRQLMGYTAEEWNRRRALYRSFVRLRCMQYVMDTIMWFGFIGGSLYLWVHGLIGAGDFLMISTLTASLLQTAYNLGHRIPDFYEQLGAVRETIGTLIVPATIQDRPSAPPLKVSQGVIEFEQVAFTYNAARGGSRNVVKSFDLYIPAGQRLGLVGPSGAGKSTLMALLMRMHDVSEGAIRIDGQDLREITQESLRNALALIPQDTSLFHRSLLDNIRYGRPAASDEEVVHAAERAHAHEFISELEHGYHTMVGERGAKLSGGQRQRIAIARAILRNAPILLLDEATSALDSHSEHMIQHAMREAMKGKTVIAIAHRLSTVMDMDRLIVLEGGEIVADGSHSQLLRQGGLYAQLWRKQSGGFNLAYPNESASDSTELRVQLT
jgi:ATP-binding cassette, subfamily B, bacterial